MNCWASMSRPRTLGQTWPLHRPFAQLGRRCGTAILFHPRDTIRLGRDRRHGHPTPHNSRSEILQDSRSAHRLNGSNNLPQGASDDHGQCRCRRNLDSPSRPITPGLGSVPHQCAGGAGTRKRRARHRFWRGRSFLVVSSPGVRRPTLKTGSTWHRRSLSCSLGPRFALPTR